MLLPSLDENLLDRLTPDEFVREIPEMLDLLAEEYSHVIVRISRKNLPSVLDALRAGIASDPEMPAPEPGELSFPDRIETYARLYPSVEFTLVPRAARLMAHHLRLGAPH